MIYASDMHLGDGSRADDFGGRNGRNAQWLCKQIDRWKAHGEKLILVGDTIEGWQAKIYDVWQEYGGLLEYFNEVVIAVIRGNHDWKQKYLMDRMVIRDLIYQGTYVFHADKLDWIVARYPEFARRVTEIVGKLEKAIHPDVDVWAQQAWYWLTRTGRYGRNDRYWEAVAREALKHGCKRVVFGHTHQREFKIVNIDGVLVEAWNCGTLLKHNFVRIER